MALSTQNSAPGEIAKHLRPFLGALALETIKTSTINEWIGNLVKSGIGPKTVENKWKYFTQIMNWYARQNDEPKRTWYPDLPHIPDIEQRWYTPEEMLQIIDVSVSYPAWGQAKGQYKPLFRLDAFSGMRSGEVTGLHVEDLDFVRGLVHVQRSIYKGTEVSTKGKRRRDVLIDSTTLQMLREFLGDRTTGRIFQTRNGTPISNQQLNVVLNWATAKLGIKRGTMHAFRHGRVSLLLSSGMQSKFVQQQVGHQDGRTTDKYTHFKESILRDSIDKLGVSCTQKPTLYTN